VKQLSAFMFALLIIFPSWADEPFIDISGYGKIEVMPDYLQLYISLSDSKKTLTEARDSVESVFQQVLKVRSDLNISKDDIDAAHISNQPIYEWQRDSSTRKYIGEQVTRRVVITLRNLDNYGRLVHRLMEDGRIHIQNTSLGFNDLPSLQRQATKLALLNARDKASFMAATLDNRLGAVQFIQEQGGYNPQPVMMMAQMRSAKMEDSSTGSEMLIQKQEIEQSVQVRFAITEK
jgi:uncharacterized protein YggE